MNSLSRVGGVTIGKYFLLLFYVLSILINLKQWKKLCSEELRTWTPPALRLSQKLKFMFFKPFLRLSCDWVGLWKKDCCTNPWLTVKISFFCNNMDFIKRSPKTFSISNSSYSTSSPSSSSGTNSSFSSSQVAIWLEMVAPAYRPRLLVMNTFNRPCLVRFGEGGILQTQENNAQILKKV